MKIHVLKVVFAVWVVLIPKSLMFNAFSLQVIILKNIDISIFEKQKERDCINSENH